MLIFTPTSFFPALFPALTLLLNFREVNGQIVVVRRRRTVGPIVAGCVIGGLFFLSILAMCCILARRRQAKAIRGRGIEDSITPNTSSGPVGGGTRIIAVRTRPTFWGHRRGIFRGPRVIAVSSWGEATGPQQQHAPAPTPSINLLTKETPENSTTPGATQSPPPYGSQVCKEAMSKENSIAESPILNQTGGGRTKEPNFVGGI